MLLGKTQGRIAEAEVRKEIGKSFYLFPKGISTKGPDVIGIKEDDDGAFLFLVAEVKSTKFDKIKVNFKQIKNLFDEIDKFSKQRFSSFYYFACLFVKFRHYGWVSVFFKKLPTKNIIITKEMASKVSFKKHLKDVFWEEERGG